MPKTYESESLIKLGTIGTTDGYKVTDKKLIIDLDETEKIIRSSTILKPILKEFFPDGKKTLKKFNKKNLEIEIFEKTIDWRVIKQIPYIMIKTKSTSAKKSRDINQNIIREFILYSKPKYKQRLKILNEELNITENMINQLKKDISKLEKDIASLSDNQLKEESISKSTLLTNIVKDYKNMLKFQEDQRIKIKEELALTENYGVMSEPQIPKKFSSPNIILNLGLALIIGLLLSVFIAFYQESLKKDSSKK